MHIRSLKDAEPFEVAGIKFGMLLPRDVTDSVEVVWEKLRADQATPIDRHPTFDQLFFILKGTGEVTIGEMPVDRWTRDDCVYSAEYGPQYRPYVGTRFGVYLLHRLGCRDSGN